MIQTQVVAMTLKKGNTFLLGRRSLTKKVAPGYWCPISGKIELGESEEQALIREAQEEIGVLIRPVKKIARLDVENRKGLLHWWLVDLVKGEPRINNDEHSEIGWFTFDQILKLEPVFQDDIAIYHSLVSE
jgi:8-oxo-dGTP pyrophosphatase MutT (NUDIX family)